MIRKGQGLVVHTHDCRAIAKLRSERGNWVDVEWEPGITGLFEASIKVVARNVRGVLARIAAGIAEAGSNIVNISMDDDSGEATTLFFTLQVSDRVHLAHILRALRRVRKWCASPVMSKRNPSERKTDGPLRIRAHPVHARMAGTASRGEARAAEGARAVVGQGRRALWNR
jgi:hypothetical protein